MNKYLITLFLLHHIVSFSQERRITREANNYFLNQIDSSDVDIAIEKYNQAINLNNEFNIDHVPDEGRVNCKFNKNIKADFYFFIGYIPCGDICLRIDIYERLAALVRNEAKKTKFKITEEMLSIAGSTKDNLKNFITETLKYQFLKKDTSAYKIYKVELQAEEKKIMHFSGVVKKM